MTSQTDPGLAALVLLLRMHGVAVEGEQLCHRLGTGVIGITEMLRCAKDIGLKARAIKTTWTRLARTPLPAIATLKDGNFLLLGKTGEDLVMVQRPSAPRPETLSRGEFEAMWDGRLSLFTRQHQSSRTYRAASTSPGSCRRSTNTAPARRGTGRFLIPAALRVDHAAFLPGRDRQGAGSPGS